MEEHASQDHRRFTVCVIQPNRSAYSETFIRAHVDRLPAKVKVLYGGCYPSYLESGAPLLSPDLVSAAVRATGQRLLHISPKEFHLRALERFLRRNQVDVVLAEYGPTGACVMDACLGANVPLVVHFHGFDANSRPTLEEFGPDYKRMFSAAHAVITVSRDMERDLLSLGVPREKLHHSPSGVDTTMFSGADPAEASPIFVAVGRFVDSKAPHLTLLAFEKVAKECPEAQLIMIGDGNLWEACKQLSKALGIADRVEFSGAQTHSQVAHTMRRARAFVQHSVKTSYGASEGTPVAVLEAGATGLPIVSTSLAGIKDVVIDGETGFLVEENDVEAMASRMIELARNPALASELGQQARKLVSTGFSMDLSITNLWRILENAIQENRL